MLFYGIMYANDAESHKLPVTDCIESLEIDTLAVSSVSNIGEGVVHQPNVRYPLIFGIRAIPLFIRVLIIKHIIVLQRGILFVGFVIPFLFSWFIDIVVSGFDLIPYLFSPE